MDPLELLVLAGAVLVGGIAGLRAPGLRERGLRPVLSFSGSYLVCVMALHVLPEAFASPAQDVGLALLAGFFVQVALERFSGGVEHGHVHVHPGSRLALPVLAGLSAHALLEGMPLAVLGDPGHAGHDHEHLLVGLALHKVPAGFALAVLLTVAGYGRAAVWAMLGAFALMSPLGALAARAFLPPPWLPYLLAAVAGSLLHVGTTILYEADDTRGHHLSWVRAAAVGAGMAAGLLTAYT